MKRIIPAILLLGLTIAFCFCAKKSVTKVCNETEKYIKKCEVEYFDGEKSKAAKTAKAAADKWEKSKKYISFFVNRDYADEVSTKISEFSVYANSDESVLFTATGGYIKALLTDLKKQQSILLENFY